MQSVANLEFKIESQQITIDQLQRKVFVLEQCAKISGSEKEVIMQLFVHGPTFDGDICSKSARDTLFKLKLAARYEGYSYLTNDGMIVALGLEYDREKEKRQREVSNALHEYRNRDGCNMVKADEL